MFKVRKNLPKIDVNKKIPKSEFEDRVRTVINRNVRLNAVTQETSVPPDSPDLLDLGGLSAYPMFIGPKWGAIAVHGLGNSFGGDTGITTPRYDPVT